jgi:hypothetical protein
MPKMTITYGEGPTQVENFPMPKEIAYHVLLDAFLAIHVHDPNKIIPVGVLPFDPSKKGAPPLMGGGGARG